MVPPCRTASRKCSWGGPAVFHNGPGRQIRNVIVQPLVIFLVDQSPVVLVAVHHGVQGLDQVENLLPLLQADLRPVDRPVLLAVIDLCAVHQDEIPQKGEVPQFLGNAREKAARGQHRLRPGLAGPAQRRHGGRGYAFVIPEQRAVQVRQNHTWFHGDLSQFRFPSWPCQK